MKARNLAATILAASALTLAACGETAEEQPATAPAPAPLSSAPDYAAARQAYYEATHPPARPAVAAPENGETVLPVERDGGAA